MRERPNIIINWLIRNKILNFGDFTLKSGRKSRYFLDFGVVTYGLNLRIMGDFILDALTHSNIKGDVLFGPAYKGIPISVATATRSADDPHMQTYYYSTIRKEDKDHGDKRKVIGANPSGRDVIIVDDVITSGGSTISAYEDLEKMSANVKGICVFVDRMERHVSDNSQSIRASTYLRDTLQIPVISVLTIQDIITHPTIQSQFPEHCSEIAQNLV